MKSKKVRLGSISLLIAVILMCVIVLGVLSISTVRSDWTLATRTAQSVSDWYALENRGKVWLARTSAALKQYGWEGAGPYLSEESEQDGDRITARLTDGERRLDIVLTRSGDTWELEQWTQTREWTQSDGMNLFVGQ